jgi:hypothetical protein
MFAPDKYGDGHIVIINLFSADWLGQCVQSSRSTVQVPAASGFFCRRVFFHCVWGGEGLHAACAVSLIAIFTLGGYVRYALCH